MKILVTGGCGYIGSHTVVELLNNKYEVVIIDDFSNSKPEVLEKIQKITNKKVDFYEADVKDSLILDKIFNEHKIDAVMHFAGFKAVGESVNNPLKYYSNNLISTLNLCESMKKHNVKNFVFSSSATVYGEPKELPIKENFPVISATNPYGETKIMIERILEDIYKSDNSWNIAILRYFNPIGAHPSGLIGEDPNGIPNNLMPYINKVAICELKELSVFGNDYDTIDGTGIRDYIHVVDLALGHIKALEWTFSKKGLDAFNLGTGNGYSVLQLIESYKKINNVDVPYKIVGRRAGDIAACYADVKYANEKLKWISKYKIEDMVRDSYNYIIMNKSDSILKR